MSDHRQGNHYLWSASNIHNINKLYKYNWWFGRLTIGLSNPFKPITKHNHKNCLFSNYFKIWFINFRFLSVLYRPLVNQNDEQPMDAWNLSNADKFVKTIKNEIIYILWNFISNEMWRFRMKNVGISVPIFYDVFYSNRCKEITYLDIFFCGRI